MATYGKLVAAADFLEGYPTLITTRQGLAETEADIFVNTMFVDFDRSLWSHASTPPEVAAIWLKVASSWYIRQNLVKTSPEQSDMARFSDFLMEQARTAASTIRTRGYTIGFDGNRVESGRATPSSVSVEFVR